MWIEFWMFFIDHLIGKEGAFIEIKIFQFLMVFGFDMGLGIQINFLEI